MAIYKKDKEVTQIPYGTRFVAAVYFGSKLIWEAVRSCYGSGQWMESKPWLDDDTWKA